MFAKFIRATVAVSAAALMLSALPALAETLMFKADMAAAPSVTTKGAGTLTATYDTATKMLTWKGEYTGLSGEAGAAHFHGPAEAGKDAGVVVPFASAKSPLEGSATLTDAKAADLMASKWYVNVHTAANPKGEIRGQVVPAK